MTASMSPPPPPLSEKAATGCVLATAVPPATSRQTVGWSHSFSVSGIDSKIGKTNKIVNKVTKRNNQHSCTVDNKVGQANQRKQNKQHIKSRAGMVWLN